MRCSVFLVHEIGLHIIFNHEKLHYEYFAATLQIEVTLWATRKSIWWFEESKLAGTTSWRVPVSLVAGITLERKVGGGRLSFH